MSQQRRLQRFEQRRRRAQHQSSDLTQKASLLKAKRTALTTHKMGKNQGARKGTVVHLAHLVANDKAHIPDRPQERAPDDQGFFGGTSAATVLKGRRAIGRPFGLKVMTTGEEAAAAAAALGAAAVAAATEAATAAAAAATAAATPVITAEAVGERPRLNLTRRGDSGDSGPAKVAPYAAPPRSGGGGDKWDNMFGGQNRGPQSDPPPPSRYGAGGGESRYGGGGDARGGYGGPSRYGAGSSDRPSGMGRYGSGNRYGALQTGSSAPAPRKEEFPTMAAATQKKEEPKHVKEASLAMEKVKLEKRRLAEEAHSKEQEAAAAKKKAEREAAEQAEQRRSRRRSRTRRRRAWPVWSPRRSSRG